MAKKLNSWCKAVRIAMIEQDLSVADLAKKVGRSRVYVSSVISGRVIPSYTNHNNVVKDISSVLNIEDTAYSSIHSD